MKVFIWPARVYYEDTDHGGVVYHANYLKFMERARTELLRSRGVELDQLQKNDNIIFAVRRSDIEYIKPAKFNDALIVASHITSGNRISLEFMQKIFLADTEHRNKEQITYCGCYMEEPKKNKLLTQAKISIVSICAKTLRPKRIPETLREELMSDY